jgi:hypothetical protein
MMKITVSLILLPLCIALAACSSSKNSTSSQGGSTPSTKLAVPNDSLDATLDALNPEFTINPIGPGRYSLNLMVGAGGTPDSPPLGALRSIASVDFRVFAPDGRLLGSKSTSEVPTSGTMNRETGEASVIASTFVHWTADEPVAPGSYAVMTIHTRNGIVVRRQEFAVEPPRKIGSQPIAMSLDVENRGPGVEFLLTVERVAPAPEGEYLPSGEHYRIEIESSVGETLWSSSYGKVFIQSIGSVEPANVGEKVEYRVLWDGISTTWHKPLEPGTYRIIATIPAKPKPYVLREEFTWSGR